MAYTDAELQAFLDGTAPADMAESIAREMAADQALEERVFALDPLAEPVRAAFDAVAPPDATRFLPAQEVTTPASGRAGLTYALAAACAVLALALALNLRPAPAPDWQAQVAAYQALYGVDTVAGEIASDATREAQTTLAGERIALSGLGSVTGAADGLTHVRTQILQIDGVPLAQIVFRTADGTPVALCGLQGTAAGGLQDMQVGVMEALASASFETDTHSWLLIGTDDLDFVRDSAAAFQAALSQI